MRAYKGIVEDGVVVLIGARLPEGTVVTVTVGETELLRARITSALKRPRKVRVRVKPTPGMAMGQLQLEGTSARPQSDE
ncbi:hypothetical protein [Deinococcus puniceus]|uniref:Uncharacterized protein n=1 Tax=Deinococcus puniceus TaxID=1182568 RepID=A0A172T920_9DEIO|nr:hypothetical protein [Deinococcus puniceus]ANE43525.1 hypothetical protein SU48_06800 [Deinococcus puniceus]